MPDTTQTTQWQGPPRGLGVEWVRDRVYETQRGTRLLWKGRPVEEDSDYVLAFDAHPELGRHGYDYENGTQKRPRFWEQPGQDMRAAAKALATAAAAVPAWREREARLEQESREREARLAAERAAREEEARTYPALVVAAARESLDTMAWAWARAEDVAKARELAGRGDGISLQAARILDDLVRRATANVDRAGLALTVPYEPEMTLAVLPGVQAAALEACRAITQADSDWAKEQNGVGWGKAFTVRGHVLAAMGSLDAAACSHALRALRRHRRQVPDDLAKAVFGGASALAPA